MWKELLWTVDFAVKVAVMLDSRLCHRVGSYAGQSTLPSNWQLHWTVDIAVELAVMLDSRLCHQCGSYTGQSTSPSICSYTGQLTLLLRWRLHCYSSSYAVDFVTDICSYTGQSTLPLKPAVTLDSRLCH